MTSANERSFGNTRSQIMLTYSNKDEFANIYAGCFMPAKGDYSVMIGSSSPNFVRLLERNPGSSKDIGNGFNSWSITGFEKGVYTLHMDNPGKNLAIGCGDRYLTLASMYRSDANSNQ